MTVLSPASPGLETGQSFGDNQADRFSTYPVFPGQVVYVTAGGAGVMYA